MPKLIVHKSKILKLTNVIINKCDIEKLNDMGSIETQVEKMQNYIKVKSAKTVGPLIQHTWIELNEQGQTNVNLEMMIQCDKFLHSLEVPYSIKSIIRVDNCMYCRYIGPEDKLKFVYDKIQVTAFEEDIALKGDNYTIYIDRNNEENTITADVFFPRADNT